MSLIVGFRNDPIFKSYGLTEKLIGYGLEILPVMPKCESVLGLPCYRQLRDITGEVDVVQVYPDTGLDLLAVARMQSKKERRFSGAKIMKRPSPCENYSQRQVSTSLSTKA